MNFLIMTINNNKNSNNYNNKNNAIQEIFQNNKKIKKSNQNK